MPLKNRLKKPNKPCKSFYCSSVSSLQICFKSLSGTSVYSNILNTKELFILLFADALHLLNFNLRKLLSGVNFFLTRFTDKKSKRVDPFFPHTVLITDSLILK